ncbi:MerR family transcriptional regulator [Rossellomorea sp. NPDC077527]|uniref:MerR family transcriptional regulator n=1 Tax=Rossellomorea sp. NPDC077527 TaxID=3364510 RepID=UPI0037C85205
MYTMKQVTQQTGLTAPTLRYYEKENLLPPVERDENGLRIYSDLNVKSILFIKALRATAMPIREIKKYVQLYEGGEETLQLRKNILEEHKMRVEENLRDQANNLEKIKEKLEMYDQYVRSRGDCEN